MNNTHDINGYADKIFDAIAHELQLYIPYDDELVASSVASIGTYMSSNNVFVDPKSFYEYVDGEEGDYSYIELRTDDEVVYQHVNYGGDREETYVNLTFFSDIVQYIVLKFTQAAISKNSKQASLYIPVIHTTTIAQIEVQRYVHVMRTSSDSWYYLLELKTDSNNIIPDVPIIFCNNIYENFEIDKSTNTIKLYDDKRTPVFSNTTIHYICLQEATCNADFEFVCNT